MSGIELGYIMEYFMGHLWETWDSNGIFHGILWDITDNDMTYPLVIYQSGKSPFSRTILHSIVKLPEGTLR